MAAYPASLPQYPLEKGFVDQRQPGTIRSQMETGAPKTRKRFTAAIRMLKWPTILNGTQRATFDTFFKTTINEGNDTFTMNDPVDNGSISVKFRSPPAWSIIGAQDDTAATRQWRAIYDLEVLP